MTFVRFNDPFKNTSMENVDFLKFYSLKVVEILYFLQKICLATFLNENIFEKEFLLNIKVTLF